MPYPERSLLAKVMLGLCLTVAASTAAANDTSPQFHYLLHCGGCHLEDGSGMGTVIPDLNDHIGFFAQSEEGRAYMVQVPGSAHSPLSDGELAEVLNWMLHTFAASDSPTPYTEDEVSASRRIPMPDAHAVRRQLLEQRYQDGATPQARAPSEDEEEAFGATLFFDTSLSLNNNQSCASCHDPGRAFSDARPASLNARASIGSDGKSTGLRNAPALTYVAFTPPFTQKALSGNAPDGRPEDGIQGGFFWDGRAATLESQVLTPFINKREMALPDLDRVADAVINNPRYSDYLPAHLDHNTVLSRVASALASYLRSDALSSFDSRYDRYLQGELRPTGEEMIGMGLFFASGFSSCAECHQSADMPYAKGELFTNHRYENIGIPINRDLMARTDRADSAGDTGLLKNPLTGNSVDPEQLAGRFKVPSLRNVAITSPYMHNGVFNELSTLMLFYNHFNQSDSSGQINPETGQPWQQTVNADGVVLDKLESGFPLNERQLSGLIAFLRMLTDERYESLL